VLGNHDRSRVASRVGAAGARLAAMLLLTLRGTPTLYYGDELGLGDVAIAADQVQDPLERNQPGLGLGRDPVRTPMPWSDLPQAGFTTGRPWLRLNDDWVQRNVAAQTADAGSMLQLYRRLLALRRECPALHCGAWLPLGVSGDLLAFARVRGSERIVVALNFGTGNVEIPPDLIAPQAQVWLSTALDREGVLAGRPMLRPHEGWILGT